MMKFLKIFLVVAFVSVAMVSCKNEAKKEEAPKTEEVATNVQEASFAISGMSCEINCARTIQSKLAKKDGVLEAKVIFNDSIATVKFDADKTNKADLMAYVDGINEAYKTAEISKEACKADCKMACCANKTEAEKKACKEDCKMECCANKTEEKKACAEDCKKECCAETKKA